MTSWLYECLCEAELAQYYPHFTALGLQKIDELAKVTMKDYSKLGVHDMNDRKRLFQLIKIIKIMQEEDKAVSSPEHPLQTNSLCSKPQESRSGPRRQLHFDCPADKDRITNNNGFEMCSLSDFSANDQKSSYLKVLEHMLPDDPQSPTKTRILSAAATGSYVQTETSTSLFSSNHFSPLLGDYDIPIIQRVAHVSGYNYGIPQSCIRQNTIEKENPWTEMEKIRVCVRKRPLGMREVRRGEINIITVEDKETLLVHEKKEAVDLTQYILQHVFYFDEVFGEACTNRDVYMKTTHPLIQHIFNGLFAREDSKHVVQIVGLQELQVDSVELLLEVILKGSKERSTGATGVNADSSRSHAIIQIQIKDSAKRTFGRISFIDLAGSERAADARDSDRQTKMEGAEINQSLLALKECIRALDQEHTHTPFRQSKLTQVLRDSFIGDAKTCMIANISPSHVATEHTLNTLRYADRVKELKKGVKCCASATSRNQTSGNSSPKRIQGSPVALPGDKCSPKKVKLGLQQSFTAAPGSMRGKAHPLASHPPNVPFAPVPKVPGKRHGSRGSLPQEWVVQTSPVKGATRSGQLAKKRAEESASLCSEKNQMGNKSARRWGSKAAGPGEAPARGKLPSESKTGQPVRPVQPRLASRAELSSGGRRHLAEHGQRSEGSTPARLASETWTDIPPHQEEREEHLRFYHQQFQQPPLLQQKFKYQPLERFLRQFRPLEGQLQNETPPLFSHSESQDGAQAEDLDDSDFSEDSFSHVSSQRTTKQRNTLENSEGSFFLHQREQSPEEQVAERQQSLLFNPRTDGDEKGLIGNWMYSRDPTNYRGEALSHGHGPDKVPLDWSREEDSTSSGLSPRDNPAEKPYCSQVDFVYGQKIGGGPALELRQNAFKSEVLGQAEGSSLPPEEDGFIFSLSHGAVPGSPDPRETVSTPLREIGQDSPTLATRTMKNSYPYQEDCRGESGTCSEYASGLMAPLTMSLLENADDEGPLPLERLAQDGLAHSLMAAGGPSVGHTVSAGDQKALLPVSLAAGHLWLSSSPPDNKPSGDLPVLSPSPIRQHPPDKLPIDEADLGEVCQSTEPALSSQEHVSSQQYEADAEAAELSSSQGFPGKPFPTVHTGGPHPAPLITPRTKSSDMADQPWAQERKYPTGLGWQELSLPRDPIKLPGYHRDIMWLKYRPIPRCLARPGSPLVPGCSPKTAGTLHQLTLGPAQQVVIRAHQEQLDKMAELGFKEETLMSQLALNDFEDTVTQLDEILALKSKCIQSLRSQLQLYLACHRPTTAPERTVVS
ncbi:kinesin-like protein KIF24 isoform X3 [Mirounga angustirostris]|uniref:kinesin-like protein KIF24 isoform X3 n=1 Tax=Mirounga angustirostris TaxID=9716 RepID=UPI00313EE6AB